MRLLRLALGLRGPLEQGLGLLDRALTIQPDQASVEHAHGMLDSLQTANEDDVAASKQVACWCDDIRNVLAARIDEASQETTRLGFEIKGRQAGNSVLHADVQSHTSSRNEAQQGLDAATAIRERNRASYQAESAETQAAIASLGDARGALAPSLAASFLQTRQDPGTVDGVLRGLEGSFTDSLAASEAREKEEQERYEELHSAKSEIVKLEAEAAQRKQMRLADQKVQVELDKALESAYSKRYDADVPLQQAVRTYCEAVDAGAAARTQKRNDEQVVISRAKADLSAGTAMRAAESLMHDSFLAKAAKASAKVRSKSLQELIEDGAKQAEVLTSMLHAEWAASTHEENELMSAGNGWATPVKAAVAEVGALAKQELDATPERWAAVERAAKAMQIADMRVHVAEEDIKVGYVELQVGK